MRFGISQEQLGLRAGLEVESASACINRYERGTRVPDIDLLEKIGVVLDRPVTYFFTKSDEEAELLTAFHRATREQKTEIVATMKNIAGHP